MWDYDKLFAEGNIIGVKYGVNSSIEKYIVPPKDSISYYSINFNSFCNKQLKSGLCQIQYIIQLDEHGNVIKKLFDREKDMLEPMPELESGMFIRIPNIGLGFIDIENNHIFFQNGTYDYITEVKPNIVEIYKKGTLGYSDCTVKNLIWHNPKYLYCFDSVYSKNPAEILDKYK